MNTRARVCVSRVCVCGKRNTQYYAHALDVHARVATARVAQVAPPKYDWASGQCNKCVAWPHVALRRASARAPVTRAPARMHFAGGGAF